MASPETPQKYVPPPQQPPTPRLDEIDRQLVSLVKEHGCVKLWTLLNRVAEDQGASSHDGDRAKRLLLLARVRRLKKLGLVFGCGRNELVSSKIETEPTSRKGMRRAPTVSVPADSGADSVVSPMQHGQQSILDYPVHPQVDNQKTPSKTECQQPAKTKSVTCPSEASIAAKALARLPRRQHRKWTGWLHGEHCWRGRQVVLPNGEVTEVYWTSRGRVWLTDAHDLPYRWFLRIARREKDVRLYRNPAAVTLGGLKRGIKEKSSAAKAATARRNGLFPCREGKRRGRPRKQIRSAFPLVPQTVSSGPMPSSPVAMDFATAIAYFSRPKPP